MNNATRQKYAKEIAIELGVGNNGNTVDMTCAQYGYYDNKYGYDFQNVCVEFEMAEGLWIYLFKGGKYRTNPDTYFGETQVTIHRKRQNVNAPIDPDAGGDNIIEIKKIEEMAELNSDFLDDIVSDYYETLGVDYSIKKELSELTYRDLEELIQTLNKVEEALLLDYVKGGE